MKFKSLKTNLSNKARVEMDGDTRFIVAPCVLIVEGVVNNVMYPASELAKFPEAWNNRPLPLSHPEMDGKFISANSRAVIDDWSVGSLFNVKFEAASGGKLARLVGETWINTNKLQTLADNGNSKASKLIEKLAQGNPIEVSTGLFTEDDNTPGTFNGVPFEATCYNYRPDHLAILVNETGACSVADGCGMMVNKEKERSRWRSLFDKLKSLSPSNKSNALTSNDLTNALDSALKEKLMLKPDEWVWVKDHGQDDEGRNFVIYDLEMEMNDERRNATIRTYFTISEADQITLSDDNQTVITQTNYIDQEPQEPVDEDSPRANAETQTQGEQDEMKIKDLVTAVIKCNSNPFGADQEEALMKMNEAQLTGLVADEQLKANCGCQGNEGGEPAPVAVAATAGVVEQPEPATEAPTVNAEEAPVTMAQLQGLLVNTLPGMIKEAVAAEANAGRKAKVLNELKANAAVRIDDVILDTMELPALEGIAKSCGVSVDYSGTGAPGGDLNVNSDSSDDIPDMAEIDWSK